MKSHHSLIYFLFIISLFFLSCNSKKTITKNNIDDKKKQDVISRYALLLNTDKKKVNNQKLYSFIDEWYGTPYKFGGSDKNGIDCSGFANKFYDEVYDKKIPRTVNDIYNSSNELNKNELKEGDFIFFKIESKKVSHIGIYLINDKFVHASTKKGIMISDLNEPFFQKCFHKFGRSK